MTLHYIIQDNCARVLATSDYYNSVNLVSQPVSRLQILLLFDWMAQFWHGFHSCNQMFEFGKMQYR